MTVKLSLRLPISLLELVLSCYWVSMGNCLFCIPAEIAWSQPICSCVYSSCSHLLDLKLFQHLVILVIIVLQRILKDFKFKTSRINKLYCLKWVWRECYIPMWFVNLIDNLCHPSLLKSINCGTTKTFAWWSQTALLSRRKQWSNIINVSWEQLAFRAGSILCDTWISIFYIIKKKCSTESVLMFEGWTGLVHNSG